MADVYGIVTDRIMALLEKGVVPWRKSWQGGDQIPQNLISRKAYRGINSFLLHSMSYESPFWVTFKQARGLGGHVRKGERSCPVVFWKWLDVDDRETGKPQQVPFLRYYNVFNVDQCQGISKDRIPCLEGLKRQHDPILAAERIVAAMPMRPEIRHGGGRACYWPQLDRVDMPKPETFRTSQEYYSVLFHELTHSTGHQSRLSRKGVAGSAGQWSAFGSAPYAREELVAEMGSAFLCGQSDIVEQTIDNAAAYIAAWLKRLRNDRKLVVQAAGLAQKAADFILNKSGNGTVEVAQ